MSKPGFEVKIEMIDGSIDEKDAMLTKVEAAVNAFDSGWTPTNILIDGKIVGFTYEIDYVDWQSTYGHTVLSIIMAFNTVARLASTVAAIEI